MASPIDADSASTQHSPGSKRAKQQVIEAADGPIWSQAGLSNNNWVPRFSVQAKQQVIEDADGCRSHLDFVMRSKLCFLNICGPMQAQLGSRVFSAWKSLQAKLLTIRLWK